jgi:hypothetical protein
MKFSGVSSTGKTVFYDADNVEDEIELPEPLEDDDEKEDEVEEEENN